MNARFALTAASLATKPAKGQGRQRLNWLRVNIGDWEAKRLRALADCMGFEFRGFLSAAVRQFYREHEEEFQRECGIGIREAEKLSRARRREIGRQRQEIRRACLYFGVCCSEKN